MLFSKSRLANKLTMTFTLAISFFITSLIVISYCRTSDILMNDFINSNKGILRLSVANFRNYLAQIDELSITFRKDNQFMEYLTTGPSTYSGETYLGNQIKNVFYSRGDIEEIQFYIPKYQIRYTISRDNDKLRFEKGINLSSTDWYSKTIKGDYFRYIEPLPQSNHNSFIFHRALVSIPGWRPLGVVSIVFNRSGLMKMIDDAINYPGEWISIYDHTNLFFYSSNSKLEPKIDGLKIFKRHADYSDNGYFLTGLNGQKYLAVYDSSDNYGWEMVKWIPLSILKDKVGQTRNLSLLIGGIFIIASMILSGIVSNTITSPLRKLTEEMDQVGLGNFTARVKVDGSYEIMRLSDKFNTMVDQINQLIKEKYLAELSEKTARLKALEAQINPHFLYNALQAIATKAVLGGMQEINEMVEALAYILRYCIRGGEQVQVADEISHIRKYLLLQAIRYEDRLDVEIEAEERTLPVMVPKLAVHTLVENAIQHGLEHLTRNITIRIHTYIDHERLTIQVTDNGPGMTIEQLNQIHSEMGKDNFFGKMKEGIGLKNLYSRLRLMYGEAAHLEISSIWGEGTKAVIRLPLWSGSGRDVSSINH